MWSYRDLVLLMAQKSFRLSYKQTILGPAWIIINPLLSSVVYLIVFGHIARLGTDGVPELLFYLCNTALWTFFSACVTMNSDTFRSNSSVFGKVYFPRLVMPVSVMIVQELVFLIQFLIIAGFMGYYMAKHILHPRWEIWPLLFVVILMTGVLGTSIGLMICSLTTKYRDLLILVSLIVRLWMYVSPVVYPYSSVTDQRLRIVLWINPVTAPMELFRLAVTGNGSLMVGSLVWSASATILCLLLALLLFRRSEKTFIDTI